VEDLARAGVEYALVDDRHFLVSGFRSDELHRPHITESTAGASVCSRSMNGSAI
jgi:hypothetical protein